MIRSILKFVRFTIAGGVFFLLPMVVLGIVLSKAYGIVSSVIHQSAITSLAGPVARVIITILFLLFVCFLSGLLMRTKMAKHLVSWLEEKVLIFIPGYSFIKTLSSSKLDKSTEDWKPAAVFIDDNEVICFVIDESEHYCSIFLPSAPAPSSGSVCVREKDKVKYLPISMAEAFVLIKKFGKGAAQHIEKLIPIGKETASKELT